MPLWLNVIRTTRRQVFSARLHRQRPSTWSEVALGRSSGIRTNTTAAPEVTKVEQILLDHIKTTGAIPFATYMQLCLSHPTHGYYMNPSNPVFGTRGDFITSPEISQVFGELVAIWLLSRWASAGSPPEIRLVELGPGRGTLMDDILRVISRFTPSKSSISVHLVETSLTMRSLQEKKLESHREAKINVHWHNSISEIPLTESKYTMLIAHEFFDALPIHLLQKNEDGWHEVLIASNPDFDPSKSTPASKHRLRAVLSPSTSGTAAILSLSSSRFHSLPVGATMEVSPSAFKIARQVGELLTGRQDGRPVREEGNSSPGGCGLIIDYGADNVFGDSFRAFKEHKIVDIFHQPGECDVTANVDFAYLREAMADLVTTLGPIPQYDFLERMGLKLRVDALVRGAKTDERRTTIQDAAKRLVDRIGMGKEYKVFGITTGPTGKAEEAEQVWPFVEVKDEPTRE
ncbi:S-adenosyl-L-methionine-dependent methyltransferase [Crucibulum laeve]|uniref:Protein arginine methyltransferase NDUFAF7 n=1 Tax=Crucibulum laeve TaxID=68775 RepID=A0A5C3M475_9AGAR|nr:S-adenosyl-L-methionine-dependent methyltransferase [Crucibulum laeve]